MNVARNSEIHEAVLLLFPDGKTIIPISTAALSVAQGSRRKLSQPYEHALILFRSGEIEKIVKIEVKGPYGKSAARKILSFLTSTWNISVYTEHHGDANAGYLYNLLSSHVIADANSPNPYLNLPIPPEEAIQRLEKAKDMKEVFAILSVPSVEDCLDVL